MYVYLEHFNKVRSTRIDLCYVVLIMVFISKAVHIKLVNYLQWCGARLNHCILRKYCKFSFFIFFSMNLSFLKYRANYEWTFLVYMFSTSKAFDVVVEFNIVITAWRLYVAAHYFYSINIKLRQLISKEISKKSAVFEDLRFLTGDFNANRHLSKQKVFVVYMIQIRLPHTTSCISITSNDRQMSRIPTKK